MPTRGDAFRFLESEGRQIFGSAVPRLVYVGHRSDTSPWWHESFGPLVGGPKISVLDIYFPNLSSAEHITSDLIHADVLTDKAEGPGLIFWDEGPEHVTREQFQTWVPSAVERGWDVLISCPWGFQSQKAEGGQYLRGASLGSGTCGL